MYVAPAEGHLPYAVRAAQPHPRPDGDRGVAVDSAPCGRILVDDGSIRLAVIARPESERLDGAQMMPADNRRRVGRAQTTHVRDHGLPASSTGRARRQNEEAESGYQRAPHRVKQNPVSRLAQGGVGCGLAPAEASRPRSSDANLGDRRLCPDTARERGCRRLPASGRRIRCSGTRVAAASRRATSTSVRLAIGTRWRWGTIARPRTLNAAAVLG